MRASISFIFLLITSVIPALPAASAVLPDVRTIALMGQPAPGLDGFSFGQFSTNTNAYPGIRLNDQGETVFLATLAGLAVTASDDEILWASREGSLSAVVREGMDVPGLTKSGQFGTLYFPSIHSGVVHFGSRLAGPNFGTPDDNGAFRESNGSLQTILATGNPAPGLPGMSISIVGGTLATSSGFTATTAGLNAPGMDPRFYSVVYLEGSGGLTPIARRGTQAPGTAAGAVFGSYGPGVAALSEAGGATIHGFLEGTGVTDKTDSGIWAYRGGSLQLVVRESDTPSIPGAVYFGNFSIGTPFDDITMNTSNQIAFKSQMYLANGIGTGIWSEGGGGLHYVTYPGMQVPGYEPDVVFANFDNDMPVQLNDAGQTAFMIRMAGDSEFGDALWIEDRGAYRLIARQGSPVPDQPAGVVFGEFETQLAFNAAGQAVFVGRAVIAPGNEYRAIFATDRTGDLHQVVRIGDQIEVAPNDLRTISSFMILSGGGNNGMNSALNSRGQFAFYARFQDGSDGVFLTDAVVANPEVTAASSAFAQAPVGATSYTPGPSDNELAFQTTSTPTGSNPVAGVTDVGGAHAKVISHSSVSATTTIAPPAGQALIEAVEFDLRVRPTGYESGDFVDVRVTNGADTLHVLEQHALDVADALDALSDDGFVKYRLNFPGGWRQVSLQMSSSSNSSTGAEGYDLDNVRFITSAVPEPGTFTSALMAFAIIYAVRRRIGGGARSHHLLAA